MVNINNTVPYSKVSGATTTTGYVIYNAGVTGHTSGVASFKVSITSVDAFTADVVTYFGETVNDFAIPAGGITLTDNDFIKSIITTVGTTNPIHIVASEIIPNS